MFQFYNDFDGEFVDQSQDKEEYNGNLLYYQNEQYCFHTENPKLNTQVQVDRYQTLMSLDADTKNIPKTFGNNFKKFMEEKIQENEKYFQENPISKQLANFINKKKTSKSADYTIQDFRDIFHCLSTNYWFQFYVENVLFLDLINSNRINDAEIYIKFIEQYLAGAKDPLNFISNRPIKDKKQNFKIKKLNEKLGVVQQFEASFLPHIQEDIFNESSDVFQNDNQMNVIDISILNHKVKDDEFKDDND
ncbi:unnamed protein product [Paramecium primaurelia]|uniref:Uncharacterized protein n=1 Tax=Paramecium primaurelia TaxID=5886 RepID=A0A8S1KY91_PARPR|nr:unnamed protein product [Paramecium primaurelia]